MLQRLRPLSVADDFYKVSSSYIRSCPLEPAYDMLSPSLAFGSFASTVVVGPLSFIPLSFIKSHRIVSLLKHLPWPRRSRDEGATKRATAPHIALGLRGEELAADFLRGLGFRPVAANFKLNVGRSLRGAIVQAEIDLIAYERGTLCFVEVKTRASDRFAAPEANVDLRKQRRITRAARAYRRLFGLSAEPYRYDVVSVLLPPTEENGRRPPPRIELLRAFWTEEKFRKRRWSGPYSDY